ncbi:MAG: hypothetical protein HC927_13560 [Deltaproteobacteria bacterium]|nr:hypothetical protein [Deltaproteobacteria bacterium]
MLDRIVVLALTASVFALPACDEADDPVEVTDFANGISADTEGGAFRVSLQSDSGELHVGSNQLEIRVGFHNPDDPFDPGKGIPGASVQVLAWMPHDEGATDHIRAAYVGDGIYRFDNLEIDRSGVWQLDFDIDVGETLREDVSFAFMIEEPRN